jgi:hypothetical protein
MGNEPVRSSEVDAGIPLSFRGDILHTSGRVVRRFSIAGSTLAASAAGTLET